MMIQLAICDDEPQAVMLHRRLVEDALQAMGAAATVTPYTASENLTLTELILSVFSISE